MSAAIGTILFILIGLHYVRKWDAQRTRDMAKEDKYPFDEYQIYDHNESTIDKN